MLAMSEVTEIVGDQFLGLESLRNSVEAFVSGQLPMSRVRALRGNEPCFERSVWKRLAEMGWVGALIPEENGGSGLGYGEMAVLVESLGASLLPEPFVASAVLAAEALKLSNGPTRDRLLSALASGACIPAFAHREEGGEGEIVRTTSKKIPVGVRLDGVKAHVYPGSGADGFLVSARDSNSGYCGLYWVDSHLSGLIVENQSRADGTSSARLLLDGVVVPGDSELMAPSPDVLMLLHAVQDRALIMVSFELVGLIKRALQMTLEYLRLREQFGKPIGSFQALQHRAVDLYIQQELAVSVVQDAVKLLEHARSAKEIAAIASRAKSRCSDAARLITREAIQLHGAIGFADEHDIGLYLQRALVLSAWLGNSAEHRRRYARVAAPEAELPTTGAKSTRSCWPTVGLRALPTDAQRDWDAMDDAAFRSEIRNYFEANYPQHLRYLLRRARWGETKDWYFEMSHKGWIAPHWPVKYGGMGLSPGKLLIFLEEQERWGIARAPDQGLVMFGPLLMKWGTEEQKQYYLPRILSGEHVWSQGYSEPGAGSDLASLRTEAVIDSDDFIINGQKIWNTLAQDTTHMFVLARTDKAAAKQRGISFFLVDLKSLGISIRPIRNIEGHEEFCQTYFDNVRVPKANLVGKFNEGWTVAKALLGFERLNHGSPKRAQYPLKRLELLACELGLMNDAEFLSKYTKLRVDVADLASAYRRFADVFISGKPLGAEASLLKVWATETYCRLVDLLIEVAGDSGGLLGEIRFGNQVVDVLSPFYIGFTATIAAGSNEIQRNILAKRVLHLPS
jgi:3-oxochol-4-en-24-oyl-CoA dehydrogenase